MRGDIDPKPLTGTVENAVAQLEADANDLRNARRAYNSAPIAEVNEKRPIAARLRQERLDVINERNGLKDTIQKADSELKEIKTWSSLLAADALQAAKETLLYQVAEAWIWKKAKSEAVRQVKNEVRRLVASGTMGVKYRNMTDIEVKTFFDAGKRNIFGLGDKALSSNGRGKLDPVLERIRILQTHTQGYTREAVRVAGLGTPREMMDFLAEMSEGIGEDARELVKASLGVLSVPEPARTILAKYLLKPPE
jgi:hypothetical protein